MAAISLDMLEGGRAYSGDILDESGRVLIPAKTTVTGEILNWIQKRGTIRMFSLAPELRTTALINKADQLIQPDENSKPDNFGHFYSNLAFIPTPQFRPEPRWVEQFSGISSLLKRLDYFPDIGRPAGKSVIEDICPPSTRTEEYKNNFLNRYGSALIETRRIIDKVMIHAMPNIDPVRELVENLLGFFLKDKNLMLNFSLLRSKHDEDLYHHSLNVCILSLNIAAAIGYSYEQLLEVGIGALLHDIGMSYVAPEIRLKKNSLSDAEWEEIHKHPEMGLFLISLVRGMPESAQYVILQHHERDNGSGYPSKCKASKIHRFARIVAIADMFDALISEKKYRKAYHPYPAMLELVKHAKKGEISGEILRYFFQFSSLFPIGSYLELKDGRVGRIVAPSQSDISRPVLSLIESETEKIHLLDLSSDPNLLIHRFAPSEEIEAHDIHNGF